jgi:biopolymer transport protein ExbD
MRFRNRHQSSSIPTIDLIPMLNVIMGVLAFFVMASMMLANSQSVDIQLPSDAAGQVQQPQPEPLIAEFKGQEQFLLGQQLVTKEQLFSQIQAYLTQNPKGAVLLKVDNQLPYEQVIQVLGEMRDVGGDRVSLAIEGE